MTVALQVARYRRERTPKEREKIAQAEACPSFLGDHPSPPFVLRSHRERATFGTPLEIFPLFQHPPPFAPPSLTVCPDNAGPRVSRLASHCTAKAPPHPNTILWHNPPKNADLIT
jgi:hypothetical protein